MHAKQNPMRFTALLAATMLWLVAAIPASAADTLTPSPVTVSVVAGASTTVNKTLALDGLPARADIIVAIDTPGSMGTPIAQAQADASNICTSVKGSIPGPASPRSTSRTIRRCRSVGPATPRTCC